MIRILLADDHAVVRKGLKETLEEIPGMKVQAQSSNGADVLQKIQQQKFHVVIMDITMPGRSGLEILEEIKRLRPETAVVIFTMHDEAEFASRALKAGAAGFLTKESSLDEVVKAVNKVLAGEKYLSASMAEQLALSVESAGRQVRHNDLSNREYEIMLRIASGRSLKQIASELSVSAKTVTTYRSRILEKMKMKTNAALTEYVVTRGLSK